MSYREKTVNEYMHACRFSAKRRIIKSPDGKDAADADDEREEVAGHLLSPPPKKVKVESAAEKHAELNCTLLPKEYEEMSEELCKETARPKRNEEHMSELQKVSIGV